MACPAIRPHFFGACPKKRCRAAKEKRFDASTSPWWARPPLPFGRKPQRDKLVRQVDLYTVGRPGAQVSLTQSAVMLGLRVRGRGGWDRTAAVAAPKSAFLWGSTPFLCARAKKWGGTGRASAVYCLIKRRTRNRARQGGLVIVLCACAPIRWAVVVAPCCHSTPFLWCLPKETVSSRQRKALFYPGGSTIRVSAAAL